jgi:hypothetical protein
MNSRYTKPLVSVAAAAALALPAIAQASHGSDDPVNHVRGEHHRLVSDDGAHHVRREHHRLRHHVRHGADDGVHHRRRGSDDGPNHR